MKRLLWLIIPLVAVVCCGSPIYLFFFYCPDSARLAEVRRKIHVGMSAEDAKHLMPDFTAYTKSASPRFTGQLYSAESTSVQCDCRLVVECEDGVVNSVELTVYNDLDHHSRVIK